MIIEYTGRHTTITQNLKTQAEEGIARIGKVTNRCTHVHVTLTEDKYRKHAELTMQCRGESLVARCESTTMEQALHDALIKLETQAVRHKEKNATVRDHTPKPADVVATDQLDIAAA
ncbi:ribosome hibernation-promoting factor, HPF/YfiA family [Granulicella cerasi]|uniref:Ribosome hibernation-promoting factor, HPF/YfiA family n=1 Tax=Granulicella cerasi TaxID=741063 RepID=A0ABW1Z850_9BACT|nr:ribosome-associated translation inhibitor RaiA [Granulicella cerasi]